ncbi:type II toxin-antitoxin system VapC family toxin [Amycolatopsis pithecellobii]|uniref:PIN domain-containing protein n=1 Tax=Amycolatopsis pithecellobii TaxID=664692 RepID=A0A6N7ZB73_9PSEU|nr:type II toxin-antitoxin system VapC family toxin [Amycolatopsis pithecellobii]MTD58980.1 PIN domain-containing protein [Amycolatopsis pithecellobii]
MIYLDASALVTFVVRRRHADELDAFLSARKETTHTNTIGFIETVRTCDQIGGFPNLMATLLRDHNEIKLTDAIRDAAVRVPDTLRSLDAIHVASAELLGSELTALVTYDVRMAEAARKAGLPVAMPGAE